MNIALFTDCYLPSKNGVVTVVEQLRESLTILGHHVVVVTVETIEQKKEESPDIYRAVSRPIGMGTTDQYFGFPWLPKLIRYLKKNKIEIIHTHTEFSIGKAGIQAAKILNIPVVSTTHTLWEYYYTYYIPMGKMIPIDVIRKFFSNFYKKTDCIVNVSSKAHDYYKQSFMNPDVPSVIIPNALNPQKFCPERSPEDKIKALRNKLGLEDDNVLLMFVGRIAEEKRVFELLDSVTEAIKRNDKLRAIVVGDGPALKHLKKLSQSDNINNKIFFTGFIDWREIHSYYEASDIYMTASLSEMHSMTILEALITGLPIVAREDSSFFDTVHHGENGYLAKDDNELTEFLLKLADDPALRKQFAEKARIISKHYIPDTFVKKHIYLYKTMIALGRKGIPNETEMQEIIDKIALDSFSENGE